VSDHRYLWIVNNFLHDMATGVWAACVLVVWMLAGRRVGMPAEAAAAVGDTMSSLFRLALAALVIIGATGGVRLGYWRRQTGANELSQKRRALLVKHALFAAIYGGGTFWLWSLIR
jgi:putative copper export protein